MTGVIYARYSAGSRQTDQSIEGQVRVCTEYCQKNNIDIIEVYADKHISGKTDDRPEFQRLIFDAKKHKFDTVIVYKTDRFARNKYDSAIYKKQLKQAGVRVLYAAEAIPEGPEGIILESLMEGLAEYYSAELAQKIRRGRRESALKGKVLGSVMPLGYKKSSDGHYEIDEDRAKLVRLIFDKYIAGEQMSEILEYLNSHGYRTNQGFIFKKNSVNRTLKNKKYIGICQDGDVIAEGVIPPIISADTFYQAQKEMKRRSTTKQSRGVTAEYLLSGKLFCGLCGSPMTGVSGTSKTGATHYYYYCANHRGKNGCKKKNIQRDKIEKLVTDLTVSYILREDIIKDLAHKIFVLQSEGDTTEDEIQELKKRLTANAAASANIMQAIEKGLAVDSLLNRLAELEKEKATLEADLARLRTSATELTEEHFEFFLYKYIRGTDEDPVEHRRKIIKAFVSKVYAYDDRLQIFYNLDPEIKDVNTDGVFYELESSTCDAFGSSDDTLIELITVSYNSRIIKIDAKLKEKL